MGVFIFYAPVDSDHARNLELQHVLYLGMVFFAFLESEDATYCS